MRLMLAAMMAVIATGALAQEDSRWVKRIIGYRHVCDWEGCRRHPVYRSFYVPYAHPSYYAPREYTLSYGSRRHECLQVRAVVGLEKYNVEEARQNAVDMWMEVVKLHHGVRFMNPDNAIVMSDGGRGPDCYVSATGTRASEKAAEVVGRRLSQCEYVARPCAGVMDEGRGRR